MGAGPQCLHSRHLDAHPPLDAHLTASAGDDANVPRLALPGTLTCSKYISYCSTFIIGWFVQSSSKAMSRVSHVSMKGRRDMLSQARWRLGWSPALSILHFHFRRELRLPGSRGSLKPSVGLTGFPVSNEHT